MPTLTKAIEIATQAHQGQVDKAGKPYIAHPLAVMGLVEGESGKILAVLYDVVEDTPITLTDLVAEGFSPECVAAVDAITKRDGEVKINLNTVGELPEIISGLRTMGKKDARKAFRLIVEHQAEMLEMWDKYHDKKSK